jgi:hypothetical protein
MTTSGVGTGTCKGWMWLCRDEVEKRISALRFAPVKMTFSGLDE